MNPTEITRAEMALIGSAFIDPAVIDLVSIHAGQFLNQLAAIAWEAMLDLHADSLPLDPITVADAAPPGAREKLVSFLGKCIVEAPTAQNVEYYAEIVRRAYVTRKTLTALADVQEAERKQGIEGEDLLGLALASLSAIDTAQPDVALPIGKIARDRLAQLGEIAEARQRGEALVTGLPTGVDRLTEFLGGVQRKLVTIICGRPGMGKSAFGLGMASAVSKAGGGVHVFSMEDIRETYADRALSGESLVTPELMRSGRLTHDQLERLGRAAMLLSEREGWIVDDRGGLPAAEIVRSVRRRRRENKTVLGIVDYIQLLKPDGREQHKIINEALNIFADAAKADNMAYLVLSQVKREIEYRADKRPMMADLRESGGLEERPRCVVALYRGSKYGSPQKHIDYKPTENPPTEEEFEKRVDCIVIKNTGGRTGCVRAGWDGPCTRIY